MAYFYDHVKDYLFHLAKEREVSTSTLNGAINALKFYYGTILKREFLYEIKRTGNDREMDLIFTFYDLILNPCPDNK